MKSVLIIPALFFLVIPFQNCTPVHEEILALPSIGTSEIIDSAISIQLFETTLFPILRQQCASCHGTNTQPLHSVSNATDSHNTIVYLSLVDFTTISNSRLSVNIKNGHQGISNTLHVSIEAAITGWLNGLVSAGISPDAPAASKLEATFSSIHSLILTPKCLNCHNPGGVRPSENYTDYQSTLDTGKVTAFDASNSGLYLECLSGEMPEGAPALSPEELAAIIDWINQGALNN